MPDLEWIKLENFIPRDILEHTRLLRRNFTRMNQFVQESPTGTVPNYYYNVLSQQYMALSEKLLAKPADAELEGLDVRTKVLVEARFAVQQELELSLKEEEAISQSEVQSSLDGDIAVENTSPEPIASPPQELEVSSMPQDIDLDLELDEGIQITLPSTKPGITTTTHPGTVHKPNIEIVPNEPQNIIVKNQENEEIQVQLPATTHGFASTNQLSTVHKPESEDMLSMPQDADPDTKKEEKIPVKLPPLVKSTAQLVTTDESKTESTRMSEMDLDNNSSRSESVPETIETGYWVEMQNVKPAIMHINTRSERSRALKKILAANRGRISCIRRLEDITYIGWIRPDSLEKYVSAVIVEFSTAQQANEAINIGIAYEGMILDCRKYHRNGKPVQCLKCQVYGHDAMHCNSVRKCTICSGQHSASECQSTVELCALCGGGHRADSSSCLKLAAEIERVSLGRSHLRPSKFYEVALPAQSDRPIPNDTPNINLSGLSYEQLLSRAKADRKARHIPYRTLPGLSYEEFPSRAKAGREARSQAADLALRGGSQTRARAARAMKRANARASKTDSYATETMTTKERLWAIKRNPPEMENMAKSTRVTKRSNAWASSTDFGSTEATTAKAEKRLKKETTDVKVPLVKEFQETFNPIANPPI